MDFEKRSARREPRSVFGRWLSIAAVGVATAIAPAPSQAQNAQDIIRLLDAFIVAPQQQPPPARQGNQRIEPAPAQRYERRRTPSPAERATVQRVQQMLNMLGFDAGTPDGVAGQRTLSAAAAFRAAYGLDPNGGIDDSLVAALSVATRNTQPQPQAAPGTAMGNQPSFPCNKAAKPAERTICSNPQLAAIDVEVARLYNSLREAGGSRERQALQNAQVRWIATRDACRTNATCLNERMQERLAALLGQQMQARGSAPSAGGAGSIASGWTAARASAARSIAFDEAGIRPVEPVLVDGRLLTGFPVMMGNLKGETLRMRYGQAQSTQLALTLYLDLAIFKQWPEVLDEQRPAYYFADRFLLGGLADEYLVGCPAGCGTNVPYPGWVGSNEFEREATYRRFRANIVPEMMEQAPSFPIGIKHVVEMQLGVYDTAREVFPLALIRPGPSWDSLFGSVGAARRLQVENNYEMPKELPVAASEAEALLSRLGERRTAYLALDQRLDEPGWNVDRDDPKVTTVVERVQLYADEELTDHIHEFVEDAKPVVDAPQAGETTAGPMEVSYWRDTVLIGGRVVATSGGLPSDVDDEPEGLNIGTNLVPLARDYALVDDPSWLDNDASAFALIFQLDESLRTEIIEEAIQRPLPESEKIWPRSGSPAGPVEGDPFAERRALEALRKRAGQVIPGDLPPQPIPLRVYCFADLDRYDFASQSFPIARHGCHDDIQGALGQGGHGFVKASMDNMPNGLALPPEEAEAFSALLKGNSRMLVSFETDLTIKSARSEAGHRRIATLSPGSNFWLHVPKKMTETLYRLDKPAPASSSKQDGVIAGDPSRIWDLTQQEQRAALLGFAQQMGSLPYDGRALLTGAAGHYGTVIGKSGPFNPSPEDPGTAGPFFAYPHLDFVQTLASALAVPREHLLNMAFVGEGEPIAGIVALLPAPYETYVRQAAADSYGQTQMIYETSMEITGVHRFDLPFSNPLLVLSVQPKTARFMTPTYDKSIPLETFDLTAPLNFAEYEILQVPSRVGQVVAAAEKLGSNVEQVVANTMRWPGEGKLDVFQRQDFTLKLVQAGRASKTDEMLWVTGELSMGEYDFATESFPPQSVSIGQIEVLRALDLPASSMAFQMNDISPFAIKMPPGEARAWAQTYPPYTKVPLRALVRTSDPKLQQNSVSFTVEVVEAELLGKETVPTVRDPTRVVYTYPFARTKPPPAPAEHIPAAEDIDQVDAEETEHEPVSWDILGVRLGDQLEESFAAVKSEFNQPQAYFATRELRIPQGGYALWESYATATLVHDDTQGIIISLYSEPPAGENFVTAVTRSQVFKQGGGPHPSQIVASLKKKYGEPWDASNPANGHYFWRSSQDANGKVPPRTMQQPACWLPGSAAGPLVELNTARRMHQAGQTDPNWPAWADASGKPWTPTAIQPFDPRPIFMPLGDCDEEMLVAVIETGDDGLTAAFYLALSNPALANRYRADNESRFMEKPEGAESGGVTIKF